MRAALRAGACLLMSVLVAAPATADLPPGTNQAHALNVNWAQSTTSGWGGFMFPSGAPNHCKPPNNFEVRAKWRVKGARGKWVTVPYVTLTIQTSRRLELTEVWLRDDRADWEGLIRAGYMPVIPRNSTRTFRVPFRNSRRPDYGRFDWSPTRELNLTIGTSFGNPDPPQRIWSCRVGMFIAGLKRQR